MPELILNTAGLCVTTGTANPVITGTTRKSGPISAIPDGTEVAYYRRYTSSTRSGFENCIGIWHASTNTIERTSVEKSSNSGSPVVWLSYEQTIDISLNRGMFYSLGRVATVADMVAMTGAAVGYHIQVQSYTATNNSGILTFVAVAESTGTADGGSYINGVGVQWKQIFGPEVSAESFGVGSSTPDDDAGRLQKAINYVSAQGGGSVTFAGTATLASSVTLAQGVSIVGTLKYPTGWKANSVYGTKFILQTGASFLFIAGCVIQGCYIVKDGVTFPQTAAQALTWTGTAISGNGAGSAVQNCLIVGFERAIDIGQTSGTARMHIESVYIDCQNGVRIKGSVDTDRLIDIHGFPFMLDGAAAIEESARAGIGIESDGCDGRHMEGCFFYGYNTSYKCGDTNQMLMSNCGSDGPAGSINPDPTGLLISGTSSNIRVSECRFIGVYNNGMVIDTSDDATDNSVNISDCNFSGGAATNQLHILNAWHVNVSGCSFIGGTSLIRIGADMALQLSVDSSQFVSGVPLVNTAGSYTTNVIRWGNNNMLLSPPNALWTNSVDQTSSAASAATMRISTASDYINVTGTTTITALYSGVPGRRVTLSFTSGLTMNQSSSIKLKTGANTTFSAGQRATFLCTGFAWYEV